MIAHSKIIQRYGVGMLVLLAIVFVGDSAWIYAKANIAQVLIKHAWQQTVEHGGVVKPWPWADTWPVAQFVIEEQEIELYVLNGTQGHALAFGPGYMNGSAKPNESGVTVIAGHRDTHFSFMEHLRQRDIFTLIDRKGSAVTYRVMQTKVVDSRIEPLSFDVQSITGSERKGRADIKKPHLLLVTCYPFAAIDAGGPLRYVATAVAIDSHSSIL